MLCNRSKFLSNNDVVNRQFGGLDFSHNGLPEGIIERFMSYPIIITIVGGNNPSDQELNWAEQIGRGLAERGVVVVTGGGDGVMEAASKGAFEAGGLTVGILPGSSPQDANQYVTIPILTGMSYARNIIVAKTGRVVIAVGGAFGTLSEIAHALGDGIPTIGLGTWELSREGIEKDGIVRVRSPKEAVDKAIEIAHNSRS